MSAAEGPVSQVFVPEKIARGAGRFAGRSWVVDQVLDWMDNGPERFLMLLGEPGSGKSALAAWLRGPGRTPADAASADKLARVRRAWSASHFCVARGPRGTVNPNSFAQSLAQQFSDRFDVYALAVLKRAAPQYNINLDVRENWGTVVGLKVSTLIVNSKDAEDVYDSAVRQPLAALYEANSKLGPLFIIVDGLDEAITFSAPNIVTLLAGSSDLPPGARFLVTSRDERRVVDQFDDDVRTLDLSDPQWAANNDADVGEYLFLRIAEAEIQSKLADSRNSLTSAAFVDQVVGRAAGNFLYAEFLLDELAAGNRAPGDLSTVPGKLYGLYSGFLDRVMPEMVQYGSAETWVQVYQPLLGSLSVALPAAPELSLPRWLDWDPAELNPRLDAVGQVTERVPDDGGSRRLYHRSMAEFLCADQYPGTSGASTNRYFVSPRRQNERIVRYYLDKARNEWNGDWGRADRYGLRQLVPHLKALLDLTDEASEQAKIAQDLYGLVLDERFAQAQQQVLGGPMPTVVAFRLALDAAFERSDLPAAGRCIQALAASPAAEVRALAAEAINRLHAIDPNYAIEQLKGLLR